MSTNIGIRIKELRMERDLSLDLLVSDMNAKYDFSKPLSKSMVSKWENGINEPTLENAKYLSMYFDVSLDYLIGLTDTRTPSRLLAYARGMRDAK